ncbi:roadblock/LC7 domain-containing protein [Leptothoe sp. PORK10 BA2]|uniref:roadblock/LC7 domain-containing protein n=1 Tax=Leptothoe sp. PORK10 BA2 TaxID=3110254 RepID=UPI002B1FAF25|nr:roadblock/LC7 domain-containing protein [Leptothoe sp. PORK10 BA2]MEA5464563.1 roadblock/LC7 domain-containing protein [Leptothoe sp. PORK10 BA2]
MAIDTAKIQATLQRFVSGTHDIEGAALVTPDGLPLVTVLPGPMDEDSVSAMTAALLSLGERISGELMRGSIEQIVIDGKAGYCILTNCGEDAVFLVLATPMIKKGVLHLEVKRAMEEIQPLLA